MSLSLDSGGNYHGYIGDVCRMGVVGEPDSELVDLLAEVEAIEQAAMKPISAGRVGQGDLCGGRTAAAQIEAAQPHRIFWRTAWDWSATRRRG